MNRKSRSIGNAGLALMAAMSVATATAQVRVASHVIASGGGVASGSGTMLNGTIGQPVIGPTRGPSTIASQGFWHTLLPALPAAVGEEYTGTIGGEILLAKNFPNPFSTETTIRLQLPSAGPVALRIYDELGQEVMTPIDGSREAGEIAVRITADDLPSGRYTAVLIASGERRAIAMMVVK